MTKTQADFAHAHWHAECQRLGLTEPEATRYGWVVEEPRREPDRLWNVALTLVLLGVVGLWVWALW